MKFYGPGRWEQAHAVDECVATEDLVACACVYARLIGRVWGEGGDVFDPHPR